MPNDRIAHHLKWEVISLDEVVVRNFVNSASSSYDTVLNRLKDFILQNFPYFEHIVGKDNVLIGATKDSVKFVEIPEWRLGDFLRSPSREIWVVDFKSTTQVNGKHPFGDGIIALMPSHVLGSSVSGWVQARVFIRDDQRVYRAFKGVIVHHPLVREPMIAWDDGYGVYDVPGHVYLEVHTILRDISFKASYSIQGLYFQGVPGWWDSLKLVFSPGAIKAHLFAAGAPLELFFPAAAHLGLRFKAPLGYGGILLSDKILPYLGHAPLGEGQVLAYTRRWREGTKLVFNRQPDLPSGQSAVEVEYIGLSPVANAIIARHEDIQMTGADFDGDIGYLYPTPSNGGLYVPYAGQAIIRKDLPMKDYPDGLARWAGQLHSAPILGGTTLLARKYLDWCYSLGQEPDKNLLSNATLLVQVAVDRQKRDVAWPEVELPVIESNKATLTDFFRVAIPGGAVSPEGDTPTQVILNRWRTWESVNSYVGSPQVKQALSVLARSVSRFLTSTDKRKPDSVLARLVLLLPSPKPRDKDLDALLNRPMVRRERLRLYDSIVESGLLSYEQATDHPELWLRLAPRPVLSEVFSRLGLVPAYEEVQRLLKGDDTEHSHLSIHLSPDDLRDLWV